MAAFLSDEWCAAALDAASALPERPGASLVVQHVVSGAPGGKVTVGVEVVDGRVVALAAGKRADAACTLTWSAADVRAVLAGTLDAEVAFMQGRLKVEGAYEQWHDGLGPWRRSAELAEVRRALASHTD